MKNKFNQEHIIGIVCILVGALVLYLTRHFPSGKGNVGISGPAFFPNLLAILLLILGAVEAVTGTFSKTGDYTTIQEIWTLMKKPEFLNLILLAALFLFFIFFVEILGFVITTTVFLLAVMWRLGVPLIRNALYSAVFLLVIIVIFDKIFTVSLPSGVLF